MTILIAVNHILDLPVAYYDGYVIKNKYTVLHKTLETFLLKETRFFFILVIFISPLLTITLNFIKKVQFFWFWSWVGFTIILSFLITIYPGYISPHCERYEPFPDGILKRSIINFMETFGMNVQEVYELKSKQLNDHSNILIGKRLGRYFVVVDKINFNQNEILAVLAHEIGHKYHKHHYKLVVMYSLYYFIMFSVFSCFYASNFLYCVVGFPTSIQPKVVKMVAIVFYILAPLNKFVRYFINQFTREIELEADKFAVESGLGEELVEAIIKKTEKIDVVCVFDPVYSICTLSQPSVGERLKIIQSFISQDDISISEEDEFSGNTDFTKTTESCSEENCS